MQNIDLTAKPWNDYELLDSGDNKKLERYGRYIVSRPETQAIWSVGHPARWAQAQATFHWEEGKGFWQKKQIPETWNIAWGSVNVSVRLTSFKHTGIFPEQAPNWEWSRECISRLTQPNVLNLFGYTGIASIVAAQAGAQVTHVDASKQSNTWAKENAHMSGVPDGAIRYILDDALQFVRREVRRGTKYEGIILDPPAFGRGAKGEVWHIEEDLLPLLEGVRAILSPKPKSFLLLNGYAAGYSAQSFLQAVTSFFPEAKAQFGELNIQEANSPRLVPSGIYVRFVQ